MRVYINRFILRIGKTDGFLDWHMVCECDVLTSIQYEWHDDSFMTNLNLLTREDCAVFLCLNCLCPSTASFLLVLWLYLKEIYGDL